MESTLKVNVFHSEISRVDCEKENHLYDLLQIEPAKPVSTKFIKDSVKEEPWDFRQSHDRHYTPKRAPSKFKVKTVSEIRAMFEKDVYAYLKSDLEQQQNYLLRKICDGYSNDGKTRNNASKLLNSETPISRSSWQMLSNINPERHNHSKQFVLWNGRCIQVNGSKGGKNKFISKHDLKNKLHNSSNNTSKFKKNVFKSKVGLLQNSLNVKFKPGPLAKKQSLDSSHHRYQMGKVELVKLPSPVLEVSPAYGTVLDNTIANFVNNMRGEKGVIPKKLAEFAVSVLGTIDNSIAVQSDTKYTVTFELNYKCKQNRLMMRRNTVETTPYTKNETSNMLSIKNEKLNALDNENTIVKQVMDEILDSVVISLNQDTMYFKEDDPRNVEPVKEKVLTTSKDKFKRKYCELDKLDVTIINLPESSKKDYTKPCDKSFCTMGCVCESLDCGFNLKQHCGVFDCMFGCKCRVSKYKGIDFLEDGCDMIPGLMNLDNEINSRLAKEEKKFHQTVIFSGDKSILLKSRKRNWKSSKKYAEFFSKMNLKGDDKIKKVVTVDVEKLCCENIESLCMVHNLYKCFCKGKFTESYVRNDKVINTNKFLNSDISKIKDEVNIKKSVEISSKTKSVENNTKIDIDVGSSIIPRLRTKRTSRNIKNKDIQSLNSDSEQDDELSVETARTMGYHGRQYDDSYYSATNKKIAEMEQNDVSLKTKMLKIIYRKNVLLTSEMPINSTELLDCETLPKDNQEIEFDIKNNMLNKAGENKTKHNLLDVPNEKANETVGYPFPKTSSKGSLKTWLESSYKSYKERIGKGMLRNSLEAPKKGKASLQRWDFILSRYSERKNMFFVSNEQPYRTFLAVDNKLPLLANCINIDDIRFADLPKYPVIIRNLVTNATDSENVFCILRGWDNCWELVGSAVKVIEKPIEDQTEEVDIFDANNLMSKDYLPENSGECEQNSEIMLWQEPKKSNNDTEQDMSTEKSEKIEKSEKSKWFVLTVENDFTEIQFYKKGFYVTYDGIQRSINLARISGKTVRLSARARTENPLNNSHPYGIYAIPRNSQSCVFIGPYEVNEPLGIEVIKSIHDSNKPRKTRGMWINTNKVDNKNVIDNPLAYLPSAVIPQEMVPMQTGNADNIFEGITLSEEIKHTDETSNEKEGTTKQIKPIKIRRTNGFYHLSSKNTLQKMTESEYLKSKNSLIKTNIVRTVKSSKRALPSTSNIKTMETSPQNKVEPLPKASPPAIVIVRPVAEVAPQIKITHVYSEKKIEHMSETSNKESIMHVLKPEEINKKVAPIVDDDIEKFLETSTICSAPQEVLVISDTEEDVPETPKYVWIQSSNVQNFGYIPAKMNEENTGISFEFPGFKYSDYYSESEAFYKINQVLARKMYIPKNVKLQWEVIHEKQNLTCGMLTTKCLEDKKYLLIKLRDQRDNTFSTIKSLLKNDITSEASTSKSEIPKPKKVVQYVNKKKEMKIETADDPGILKSKDEQIRLIEDLEEASNKLEQQSDVLWNEAVSRRNEIFGSLSVSDNIKSVMTKALQDIMARHENDDE